MSSHSSVMTVSRCSSKDCTVERSAGLCIKYLNRKKESSSKHTGVPTSFWRILPSLFSLTGVKMFSVWQGLGLKNSLLSSLSWYFPLCCLSCKMIFSNPVPVPTLFSQILPRDSQVSHQPVQHLIIKQGLKHWEKKANRKEKNVNSITSWLPGESYLISLCLPGCKFLRGKGCLNKCFVECLSQHHACVLAQWQMCHRATCQLLYVMKYYFGINVCHMICVLR